MKSILEAPICRGCIHWIHQDYMNPICRYRMMDYHFETGRRYYPSSASMRELTKPNGSGKPHKKDGTLEVLKDDGTKETISKCGPAAIYFKQKPGICTRVRNWFYDLCTDE